jgi:energy-converting hydrogenase Eha subunit C
MINVLKWVATIVTVAGAIATALMIDPLNIWLLNLGAFLFLIWGFLIKEKAMIAVNAGLLLVYVGGIFYRM